MALENGEGPLEELNDIEGQWFSVGSLIRRAFTSHGQRLTTRELREGLEECLKEGSGAAFASG